MYDRIITEQFNKALEESLKDSKYRELQGNNIIKNIWEKMLELLMDLFSNVDVNYTDISSFLNIILAIIVILMAILLFLIFKKIMSKLQKKSIIKYIKDDTQTLMNDFKVSASDLSAKGKRFAQEGQFREAIRYHYIALLLILRSKNILSLDDFKTNGQILRELKLKNYFDIDLFSEIVSIVDASWYGYKKIYVDTYEDYIIWYDKLILSLNKG